MPFKQVNINSIIQTELENNPELKRLWNEKHTSVLLETLERDCPICSKTHLVEKRSRLTESVINNTVVKYRETYYCCPDCNEENEFVSGELLDMNLLNAKAVYSSLQGKLNPNKSENLHPYIDDYEGISEEDRLKIWG
jgi:translation initiation factor 2 beta subunit (eIF-2beta)/eIF-5